MLSIVYEVKRDCIFVCTAIIFLILQISLQYTKHTFEAIKMYHIYCIFERLYAWLTRRHFLQYFFLFQISIFLILLVNVQEFSFVILPLILFIRKHKPEQLVLQSE